MDQPVSASVEAQRRRIAMAVVRAKVRSGPPVTAAVWETAMRCHSAQGLDDEYVPGRTRTFTPQERCDFRGLLTDYKASQTFPVMVQHSTGSRGLRGSGKGARLTQEIKHLVSPRALAVKAEKPVLPCGCESLTEHSIRCAPTPTRCEPVVPRPGSRHVARQPCPQVQFLAQKNHDRKKAIADKKAEAKRRSLKEELADADRLLQQYGTPYTSFTATQLTNFQIL